MRGGFMRRKLAKGKKKASLILRISIHHKARATQKLNVRKMRPLNS
jgi:hypothetical protein